MDRYYARWRGKVSGPFTREQLAAFVKSGQVTKHYSISMDRLNWTPAASLNWLFPRAAVVPIQQVDLPEKGSPQGDAEPQEDPLALEPQSVAAVEPSTPSTPANRAEWKYCIDDGCEIGPVSLDVIKKMVAGGHLKPDDQLFQEGMKEWVEARTVDGLVFPRTKRKPPQAAAVPHPLPISQWGSASDQCAAPPMQPGLDLQAPEARPPDPYELSACPSCGSPWKRFELQCTVCNWDPVKKRHVAPRTRHSGGDGALSGGEKATGCLLALFFGGLGAHRFFLGHYGVAILQLLLALTGAAIAIKFHSFWLSWLISIWILIDGVRILTGSLCSAHRGDDGHHGREAAGTNGFSNAALLLALISLFILPPFVGLAAFICAIIGLVTSESKGLAVVALLLSIAFPIAGMFMGALSAVNGLIPTP